MSLLKVNELSGDTLNFFVAKAMGRFVSLDPAEIKAYLESLDEDTLWNELCANTPGAIDASFMVYREMIDYGVRTWITPNYCGDWALGGPIIDSEAITVRNIGLNIEGQIWDAAIGNGDEYEGPTALIAAMRCYVASKLGEDVKTQNVSKLQVKVSNATQLQINWMVAKCQGLEMKAWPTYVRLNRVDYTTNWALSGPIIEREGPLVRESAVVSPAIAHLVTPDKKWFSYAKNSHDGSAPHCYYGETFLIAAMRCYVASQLGDEVEVPEEIL